MTGENPIRQGDIVWADVQSPNGEIKQRPLVIITDESDICMNGPLVGVAISTTLPENLPDAYVELPWDRRRHPATQLARRCAAVCNWLVSLRPSDIIEIKGFVPAKILLKVIERVRLLNPRDRD